jgi:hypothetical protein
MNIVLGKENVEELRDKHVVLELDSFYLQGADDPVTAYGIVEKVPIEQISSADQFCDLHNNMMKNYRLQNWKYVEDALEHLVGKWCGEYDTFYNELSRRVTSLKSQELDSEWNGIIRK